MQVLSISTICFVIRLLLLTALLSILCHNSICSAGPKVKNLQIEIGARYNIFIVCLLNGGKDSIVIKCSWPSVREATHLSADVRVIHAVVVALLGVDKLVTLL